MNNGTYWTPRSRLSCCDRNAILRPSYKTRHRRRPFATYEQLECHMPDAEASRSHRRELRQWSGMLAALRDWLVSW
jgi:hypothetical protein